jgi:polar amino acid transport system permease protein
VSWRTYFTASNDPGAPPPAASLKALNFCLALFLVALIFYFAFASLAFHLDWGAIAAYRWKLAKGWGITVALSAIALVLSAMIGLLGALAQRSPVLVLRYLSKIYVEVIRGTPLLAQILIFFYVVADAFGLQNRYAAGVLILSFFSGAYITEIIRAGIESIGKSQLESARAIGLTGAQTYRYVIFPQAIRQILPPLAGQFVSLVKDSSLLSIIGVSEFTWQAESVNALTYRTLEAYLPLALGYLILTLPISLWTRHLERRHKFDT